MTVQSGDHLRIRAYLLRRLPEAEQHAFESRLLDERDLLEATRATEEAFLRGDHSPKLSERRENALYFALGAAAGVALLEIVERLIA